jgi:hypothetical protein
MKTEIKTRRLIRLNVGTFRYTALWNYRGSPCIHGRFFDRELFSCWLPAKMMMAFGKSLGTTIRR